ncbi:MAG: hypothetical protein J6P88_03595 [Clostridia bacterium]|nr:hypothetical protein [Clostridia bacterium]
MRKVFTILLVLFPFLNQFGLPVRVPFLTAHFSIGYLVLLPFAVLFCLLKIPTEGLFRTKVYGFRGYVLFLLTAAFSAVMARQSAYYSGREKLIDLGIMILFWLIVLYASRDVFNVRFGMTCYAALAVIFSAYFIVQFVVFRLRGIYLPTIFRESYVFGGVYTDAFRATGTPTSLFTTTADFALYCLPAVAFLLLWDRIGFNGREFICAVVVSAGLVLTRSVPIIVALVAVWGLYVLFIFVYFIVHPYDATYRFTHQKPSRIVLQLVFPILLIGAGAGVLATGGRFSALLSGFKDMLRDPALVSGFEAAGKAGNHGAVVRLFGCGVGNAKAFLSASGVDLPAKMNGIGYVYLSVGLVGLILFIGSLFAILSTRRGKFGFAMAALSLYAAAFGNIVCLDISVFWILLALVSNDNGEMSFRKFLRLR